jgi:LPS-assembly protein
LQLIEPRIQLVGLTGQVQDIPNQDSTRVEFDEGNLFRFNRAPGFDQTETGARLNIGVSGSNRYVSSTTIGWQVGRVYRQDNLNKFSSTSGLSGSVSDWLLVGSLETASGIELITRALLKDAGDVNKTEARIKWQNDIQKIAATYVGLSADSLEDRATSLSSLALNWQYNFTPNWRSTSEFQFDSTIGKFSKLDFGVRYANECVNINFSASRRFSTSTRLTKQTEFGLSVDLTGFSSGVRKTTKSRLCGS